MKRFFYLVLSCLVLVGASCSGKASPGVAPANAQDEAAVLARYAEKAKRVHEKMARRITHAQRVEAAARARAKRSGMADTAMHPGTVVPLRGEGGLQ